MDGNDPLLVDTGRGFSIQHRGLWLYSRRDPQAASKAVLASLRVQPETLYLLPSPCLGYGLRELLAILPASSAVLCIEADEALERIARKALEGFPDLVLESPERALSAYRSLETGNRPRRFRRVVEVRLSAGWALHEASYRQVLSAISDDIALRFRNRLSLVRMGRLWAKNVIANLGAIDWEKVAPLPGAEKPVLVCGAGPSLDAAIPLMARHRSDIYILACDTAAGALAARGLLPDAIVCLEGQVINVADFLPLSGQPVRLVADLSAHPSSFRLANTESLTLTLSEWTESAFIQRLARAGLPLLPVPPLGSVGVLAIHLAGLFGLPVALAGLDFSFMQGKTHCDGSPADVRARMRETRTEKRGAAWDSSFREACTRLRDGSITDPALSMYAALAATELRPIDGYELRSGLGLPLPLKPLPEQGLFALAIAPTTASATAPATSSAAGQAGAGMAGGKQRLSGERRAIGAGRVDAETCRRRAAAFLEGELERVEALATALRDGGDRVEIQQLLAEADFLYAHFPDPDRVLALENDALRRVAAEAAYWRGRLEAARLSACRRPRSP